MTNEDGRSTVETGYRIAWSDGDKKGSVTFWMSLTKAVTLWRSAHPHITHFCITERVRRG